MPKSAHSQLSHFNASGQAVMADVSAKPSTRRTTAASAFVELTVYDMTKVLDKTIVIRNIQLEEKSGGKSGDFSRKKTRA
jgi:molybdenum cofactor biosynthesis enzyme